MKKRWIALCLAFFCLLGLTACAGAEKPQNAADSALVQEASTFTAESDDAATDAPTAATETTATEMPAADVTEAEIPSTDAPIPETTAAEGEPPAAEERACTEYEISRLNGSISVPDTYYVFSEELPFTDQMCFDIGVQPENIRAGISLLEGQTLIVPADQPYTESTHIYLKVKDKKYQDITLSELSMYEYDTLVSAVISGFGVSDYETVEGNGLRFFVFTADQGLGNVCRYATILNGHMIYVYRNTGDRLITADEKADLEFIALSIRHGLS